MFLVGEPGQRISKSWAEVGGFWILFCLAYPGHFNFTSVYLAASVHHGIGTVISVTLVQQGKWFRGNDIIEGPKQRNAILPQDVPHDSYGGRQHGVGCLPGAIVDLTLCAAQPVVYKDVLLYSQDSACYTMRTVPSFCLPL